MGACRINRAGRRWTSVVRLERDAERIWRAKVKLGNVARRSAWGRQHCLLTMGRGKYARTAGRGYEKRSLGPGLKEKGGSSVVRVPVAAGCARR